MHYLTCWLQIIIGKKKKAKGTNYLFQSLAQKISDGVMIGRAAIGYPWIFNEIKHFVKTGEHLHPPTIQQRVNVIHQHLRQSIEWKGLKPGINEMRRHYTNYLKGLPNIKDFRLKLVTLYDVDEIFNVLKEIVAYYEDYEFAPRQINMESMAYSC
jgi:tRNA-dihydrouridine synthase